MQAAHDALAERAMPSERFAFRAFPTTQNGPEAMKHSGPNIVARKEQFSAIYFDGTA